MRLFVVLLILMFFSCKKEAQQQIDKNEKSVTKTVINEKQLVIKKCFKPSYQGNFNGSTIQLSIDSVQHKDDYNYKIFGNTTHKNNTVAYEGMLQLDNVITSETSVVKKFNYNLQEVAAKHGAGKFSGYVLIEVPVLNNDFDYNSASVTFMGNYVFPDGNTLPCTFGLEN